MSSVNKQRINPARCLFSAQGQRSRSNVFIGGFNQRQGEALPPQIFLTLSRFVFTVQMRKIGSVYSQENYRNCCHLMSDFKAKKAPNSISAESLLQLTPLVELTVLHGPNWPHPRFRPPGLETTCLPKYVPKSTYEYVHFHSTWQPPTCTENHSLGFSVQEECILDKRTWHVTGAAFNGWEVAEVSWVQRNVQNVHMFVFCLFVCLPVSNFT